MPKELAGPVSSLAHLRRDWLAEARLAGKSMTEDRIFGDALFAKDYPLAVKILLKRRIPSRFGLALDHSFIGNLTIIATGTGFAVRNLRDLLPVGAIHSHIHNDNANKKERV